TSERACPIWPVPPVMMRPRLDKGIGGSYHRGCLSSIQKTLVLCSRSTDLAVVIHSSWLFALWPTPRSKPYRDQASSSDSSSVEVTIPDKCNCAGCSPRR